MIEELVRRQAGFRNVRTFLTNAVEEAARVDHIPFHAFQLPANRRPLNCWQYEAYIYIWAMA